MEEVRNFVAISTIYLPDAISTLTQIKDARTLQEAVDRADEAKAVLKFLINLSQVAATELKTFDTQTGENQEAAAMLKCLALAKLDRTG